MVSISSDILADVNARGNRCPQQLEGFFNYGPRFVDFFSKDPQGEMWDESEDTSG